MVTILQHHVQRDLCISTVSLMNQATSRKEPPKSTRLNRQSNHFRKVMLCDMALTVEETELIRNTFSLAKDNVLRLRNPEVLMVLYVSQLR